MRWKRRSSSGAQASGIEPPAPDLSTLSIVGYKTLFAAPSRSVARRRRIIVTTVAKIFRATVTAVTDARSLASK